MDITISKYWQRFTDTLFAEPKVVIGDTTETHLRIMLVLDTILAQDFLSDFNYSSGPGRPSYEREPFLKAFIAKAVLNLPTTVALIDRLNVDISLRRICGFLYKNKIPCAATFSNVFNEFADQKLLEKIHEYLVRTAHDGHIVHNVSRDSTAIEARETVERKKEVDKRENIQTRKRGRPKKDEVLPQNIKEPSIVQQQVDQPLDIMLSFLNRACDYGCKRDSKGFKITWKGYKLHIDTGDFDIPLTCLLTAASVHDSCASLPLEKMTSQRVQSLYTLADSAYDAQDIKNDIEKYGKVAVIDHNRRRGEKIPFDPPKKERYKARSSAERVNSLLKDHFGGSSVMVTGANKIMCHLMFGIVSITALQIAKVIL
jgi:transposase